MAENETPGPSNALLEQARNMLQQGDWRTALRLLHRLKRERPDDAQVYAAMGDCYAAAERWHRAVAAYEQSLELAYDADVAQRLQTAREQAARSPEPLLGASPQTLIIVALTVLAAGIAVAILLWALMGGRPPSTGGVSGPAGRPQAVVPRSPARPRQAASSPWQVPSAGAPPSAVARARGSASGSGGQAVSSTATARAAPPPAAAMPPVRITKRVEAPATDWDYYLTEIVGSLTWPDNTPLAGNCLVQFDPYTGYAFVTIRIPRSLKTASLAQVTLRMAQGVAWALFKTEPAVKYVTVRALYAIEKPARRATTVVAFRGNTSRVAYEYWERLGRQPSIQELWNDVFATCWWNPNVPAAAEPQHK